MSTNEWPPTDDMGTPLDRPIPADALALAQARAEVEALRKQLDVVRADERSKCAAELRARAEYYAVTLDTPPNSDERRAAIAVAIILLSAAKRMDGTDPNAAPVDPFGG